MFRLRRPIALALSGFIILAGSALIYTEYGQKNVQQEELTKLESQLAEQKEKNQRLQEELNRLSDSQYAKNVEVSKYSLTNPKEGEYVFVLPEKEK